MEKAHSAVGLLGDFMQSCFDEQWDEAAGQHDAIARAEQDADEIKRDIRTHLPRSIFLPFARSDLLELLRLQDRLANRCRHIAHLMITRHKPVPEDLRAPLKDFHAAILEATAQARKIINELDELLETGFRGREAERVEKLVAELDKCEIACMARETALRTRLYELEESLAPVDVLFLDKLADELTTIMNAAHRIGGQLLQMMAN